MNKKLFQWQEKIIEYLTTLSDEELFDYIIEQSRGDDWENEFTSRGYWEFEYCIKEFKKRIFPEQ